MTADGTAIHPQTPIASVPAQKTARVPRPAAHRIVRQIEAVDAWIAARRDREHVLRLPGLSRDERMDAAREVEALRRTHDAIKGRCARGLDADVEPMRWPGATAVLAHRHAWLVDKLGLLLAERGVTVLVCTDNAAEALGAVVAEQPDLLLIGDRLAMMPGHALLAESRIYSPGTLLAAQAFDQDRADALRATADSVFLGHHLPADIADALALHLTAGTGSSRA